MNRKNIYKKSILDRKDKELTRQIHKVHRTHTAYGHRRVALELGVNKKRVRRVMKKYGIKPPRRKGKKHWCTRSTNTHDYTNLIKERVKGITTPHDVWVSDISYIKYRGRFWYLATIEDIGTRQIMAAEIGKKHDSQLIIKTIIQALSKGKKPNIFHSDQGTEFMAGLCTEYLEKRGIRISVSSKGSPWENGYKESFYGRFKDEFGDPNRFETAGELIEEIYSKIRYYNYERIHTRLKMPPAIFAEKVADNGLTKWGT